MFLSGSWVGDTFYLAYQGKEPHMKFKDERKVERYLLKLANEKK